MASATVTIVAWGVSVSTTYIGVPFQAATNDDWADKVISDVAQEKCN